MKVLVVGSRSCKDKELIYSAINLGLKKHDISPSEIISGGEKGFDEVVVEFAKTNGYNIITFPIDWGNIEDIPLFDLKPRFNKWTKKNEYYDPKAAFKRNDKMISRADFVIIIDLGSGDARDVLTKCKKSNKAYYEYEAPTIDPICEFGYNFWSN
jgi:hypothetical protein